ncbi:MAG: hypothetical protein B6U78_01145 [Candidatus Aenigmarchaeota archaeon ex4484_224]|nr:MAG: hypothetical protein B6U78_01145 [Candidatus Aenigmarchaeota archaeon ex4484_224]
MKIILGNRFGIKKEKITILLDPIISDFHSFISHAHGDHSPIEIIKEPFATKETSALLKVSNPEFSFKEVSYNKKVKLDNFSFEFLNAGHILGSSQIYFEFDGFSLLYTGDINTKDTFLIKKAKPKEADILMIESTYGYPGYKFPNQEEVVNLFIKWVKNQLKKGYKVEIGAYQIGKAQEAIKILNEFGIVPKVTETIRRYSEVYKKFGIKLNYCSAKENCEDVLIKPVQLIRKSSSKVKTCVLTGWALFRKLNHLGFPISDHSDFYELLEYVKQVNPKKVIVVHGFTKEFAKEVRKRLRIDAIHLDESNPEISLKF